ncbi:hypothetical protein ACQZ44_09560 [Agrobacterium vitis]
MKTTGLSAQSGNDQSTIIDINESYQPYVAGAVIRFNALHPDANVTHFDTVMLSSSDASSAGALITDFYHCLYREKIYADTLHLRQALINGVLGR